MSSDGGGGGATSTSTSTHTSSSSTTVMPPPLNVTMVAVDKDKNSAHAFRWTIRHVDNPVIIAAHVKHKNIPHHGTNVFPPDEDDIAHVFKTLRQMCHSNDIKLKEAVIDDSDVVKGIVEYAYRNRVNTIVVGGSHSTKHRFARSLNHLRTGNKKFRGPDVTAEIMKSAPDYSSVYVISKGKIAGARPAIRPMLNVVAAPKEHGLRSHSHRRGSTNGRSEKSHVPELPRCSSAGQTMNQSQGSLFCNNLGESDSSGSGSGSHKNVSTDGTKQKQDSDPAITSDGTKPKQDSDSAITSDSQFIENMEAEMRMLRLKLMQTMDMYHKASNDAALAQNSANETNKCNMEEELLVDEAKMTKEAALAMAEKEKMKAKAALEAAEEAIKMVEKEAQRRFHAERKARREAQEKDRALTQLTTNDIRCRKYSISEIEIATQNFSKTLRIGEGGYGPVFKGQLDHTRVAIKILNPEAANGRRQFQQEVEVLCRIRHPNMVLLLGACPEYGCLVYEYLDNGSLEDRLLMRNESPPIPWWKRFEIASEIATALLFLHQTKPEPIVHRDLKPANILLDKNFVSKISDVGLARLVPPSVADSVTQYYLTAAAGTLCYIDPEYQQTGKLTTKSDIYSLGILLLQIITAKPPTGLTHHVKRAIEKGTLEDMLDPMIPGWPIEEATAYAKLALSCSELSKKDRPDLGTVVVPELNRLRDFGFASQNVQSRASYMPRRPTTHLRSPTTPAQSPRLDTA